MNDCWHNLLWNLSTIVWNLLWHALSTNHPSTCPSFSDNDNYYLTVRSDILPSSFTVPFVSAAIETEDSFIGKVTNLLDDSNLLFFSEHPPEHTIIVSPPSAQLQSGQVIVFTGYKIWPSNTSQQLLNICHNAPPASNNCSKLPNICYRCPLFSDDYQQVSNICLYFCPQLLNICHTCSVFNICQELCL